MCVLFIVRPAAGGMRRHLLLLLRFLARDRFRPLVAIAPDTWLQAQLSEIGVETHVVTELGSLWPRTAAKSAALLSGLAVERGVVLVHSHGFRACPVGGRVARSLGLPHVCTVHTLLGEGRGLGRLRRLAGQAMLGSADVVIAVAGVISREIGASQRVRASRRVRLIYNGVDAEGLVREAKSGKGREVLRRLGIEAADLLVGFAGRLAPEKGADIFLEAAGIVARRRPDAQFVVVGDGPEREHLRRRAAELGLADRCRFLGFRDDAPALIGALSVLAMPSRTEGFPFVLLEALAQGTPVVASDVGGVHEVLSKGGGLLVRPGDAESLAAGIERLLADGELRLRLAGEGAAIVETEFSAQLMAERTEALYEELLGGGVREKT